MGVDLNVRTEQYRALSMRLLPQGYAWDKSPRGWLWPRLRPIAYELALIHGGIDLMLLESDPRTTTVLLPEWETSVGLPDACTPAAATLGERRAAVIAKLLDTGGQRLARWRMLATTLGYEDVQFKRLTASSLPFECGTELAGEEVRFAWEVWLQAGNVVRFEAGNGQAGDPITRYAGGMLECVIRRDAHAQSLPLFIYDED